ncbi:hypothetical protein [Aliarcobacter butzleri]
MLIKISRYDYKKSELNICIFVYKNRNLSLYSSYMEGLELGGIERFMEV